MKIWPELYSGTHSPVRRTMRLIKGRLIALAGLKLLIQKRASLLISSINFQAIKKHLLILSTRSLKKLLLILRLRCRGNESRLLLLFCRSRLAATEWVGNSPHGTVGDRRSGTKCHALRNRGADAREHATALCGLWLHGCGRVWSRCRSRWSRACGSGCQFGCFLLPTSKEASSSARTTTTTRALKIP